MIQILYQNFIEGPALGWSERVWCIPIPKIPWRSQKFCTLSHLTKGICLPRTLTKSSIFLSKSILYVCILSSSLSMKIHSSLEEKSLKKEQAICFSAAFAGKSNYNFVKNISNRTLGYSIGNLSWSTVMRTACLGNIFAFPLHYTVCISGMFIGYIERLMCL